MAKPVWIEFLMKGNLNKGLDDARHKAESLDSVLKKVGATVGIAFGTQQAIEFAGKIMDVRGEVESLQISFETLAGKAKGDKLFGDIREFAVNTPMMMQDLAKGAQTLLGFNIEAEKVMPTLKQIGDISMGDSQKFNSLVLAFAQMSSTGRLMGQDLLQMINAGFNPLVVISEKTGKSMAQLKKEMADGKITVDMVSDAFASATAEGGKFHGMLEKQSKGIKGAMGNLEGAWVDMLNDIGEKRQGAMVDAINVTQQLVKNYDKVLDILAQIIVAYGSYKAALMMIVAAQKAMAIGENIRLIMMMRKELGLLNATQQAFNITAMKNPYVLIGVAAAAAGVSIYKMGAADNAAEAAQKALNKTVEEASKLAKDHQDELDELTRKATDEAASTDDRRTAMEQLMDKYPGIIQKYIDEEGHLTDIINLKREIARLDGQKKSDDLKGKYDKAQRYLDLLDKGERKSMDERKEFMALTNEIWDQQSLWTQIKYAGNSYGFASKYYKNQLPEAKTAYARSNTENRIREFGYKLEDMTDDELGKVSQYTKGLLDKFGKKTKAALDSYTNDYLTEEDLAGRLGTISSILDRRHPHKTDDAPKQPKGKTALEIATERKQKEYDQQRGLDEYTRKTKLANEKSELEIRQARLDADEEGTQKELEQIDINYNRLLLANKERREQMIKELQEAERKQWEMGNPNASKEGKVFNYTKGENDLTEEQKATLKEYENVANEYEKSAKEKLYKELLKQYQDYETQRTEINKKFDADRRAIEEAPADQKVKEAALAELERKRKESLKSVSDEETAQLQKTSSLMISLFEDAAEKSSKQIRKIVKETKELLDYLAHTKDEDITPKFGFTAEQLRALKESPEKIKAIQEQYKKLKEEALKNNPFKTLAEDIKDLFKKKDKDDKESTESKLKKLGKSAAETAELIGGVAGNLREVFSALGNDDMAQSMEDIETLMGSVSNIGKGFSEGGIIGGITAAAGEALNFVSKAFAANARHKQALKEIMNETIAQQRAYNLLLMEQNLEYEKGTTIFGSDAYGKAINAIAVMKDAVAALNKELRGDGNYSGGKNFLGIDLLTKARRDYYNAYAGLANLKIKTGHKKTGLFGWGSGKDIYSSILEVYPDLINKEGELNEELAETILNTRTMSDEDKAALQNMINLSKEAKAAIEEMRSYLTNTFGELGNVISDALVDAFRNGTDAGKAFYESVSKTLEKLATEMIYSVTLQNWFSQAQEQMEEVMKNANLDSDAKFQKYVDILDQMTDGVLSEQGNYTALLEKYKKMAEDKGFDLFASDASKGQTAKSGGFSAMSQDQGTKLDGMFTAGLQHWASMDENIGSVVDKIGGALDRLKKIEENTEYCKRLDDIAEDISYMKKNGVKMK